MVRMILYWIVSTYITPCRSWCIYCLPSEHSSGSPINWVFFAFGQVPEQHPLWWSRGSSIHCSSVFICEQNVVFWDSVAVILLLWPCIMLCPGLWEASSRILLYSIPVPCEMMVSLCLIGENSPNSCSCSVDPEATSAWTECGGSVKILKVYPQLLTSMPVWLLLLETGDMPAFQGT